jgi:hypothetical protein
MTAQQAVARFQQTEQELQDHYRKKYNDIPAEYYDELLSTPMDQFERDLKLAGLEPGDYDWWLACCQVGLQEFIGDGSAETEIQEHLHRQHHRCWTQTTAGLAAILKYPVLGNADEWDPEHDYLDPTLPHRDWLDAQSQNKTMGGQAIKQMLDDLKKGK